MMEWEYPRILDPSTDPSHLITSLIATGISLLKVPRRLLIVTLFLIFDIGCPRKKRKRIEGSRIFLSFFFLEKLHLLLYKISCVFSKTAFYFIYLSLINNVLGVPIPLILPEMISSWIVILPN